MPEKLKLYPCLCWCGGKVVSVTKAELDASTTRSCKMSDCNPHFKGPLRELPPMQGGRPRKVSDEELEKRAHMKMNSRNEFTSLH